jgi:sortase A
MRDKRSVDELSLDDLERVLAIKRREARQQRLQKMERGGRLVDQPMPEQVYAEPSPPPSNSVRITVPALEAISAAVAAAESPQSFATVPDTSPHFEDGDEQPIQVYAVPSKANQRWKRFVDRLLLAVEVAAVVGIVVIGYSLFSAIRDLERETASAQALSEEQRRLGIPTIAPTPSLRMEDYVIPGGHIIGVDGSVRFNYEEVPPHLLPLVQTQLIQPVVSRPTTTTDTALTLIIPKLNLNQSIVQGVDMEALKQGVGQLPNNVNPGNDTGNVVLGAHNDVYGEIFRHLDQLAAGDEFQIATRTTVYTYVVTEVSIVEPTDVWVLENREGPTATLFSCYPYRVDTQRIVVMADRVA